MRSLGKRTTLAVIILFALAIVGLPENGTRVSKV